MENLIANPEGNKMKASKVLGTVYECQRRLEEAGLSFKAWQWPIDDADFRVRLAEFWMSRGKLSISEPVCKWREKDGVIYLSVTSYGTTGPQWISRLESKDFRVSDYAKQLLRSDDFKPTNGVTTEVAVLKGELFNDNDRITKKIRAEANKRKLEKPNAEVACLIREKFTDEELEAMGLWYIVAMHEPIEDSGGSPYLLCAYRSGGGRWLDAYYDWSGRRWDRDSGFAFAMAQVS